MEKTTMMANRFAAASAVAVLALTLIGCTTTAARPSAEDLKSGLTEITSKLDPDAVLPDKYTECVANSLLKSDLSDETLAKIADAKELTPDEVTALNSDTANGAALTEAATSCATTLQ